jgi:molybdate transport system permease protein
LNLQPLFLSIQVALVATLLAFVVGVGTAILLSNKRMPGRELLDAIITAPMVLPPTVLGYYVLVSLGRQSFIGKLWEGLFDSSIVFTRTGAVIAATIGSLPLIIKAARASIEGVDPTLVLAARTLGASPMRVLFTIVLPLARRGLLAGVTLGFARALGDFGVTLMVAGDIPGETQTASLAIYDAIQSGQEQTALAMVLILTSVGILALYMVNRLGRLSHD